MGKGWQQKKLIPRPDPTKLTTKAVSDVTALFRRELGQLRELIEARLDAGDKMMAQHVEVSVHIRTEVEERITHLREMTDKQFAAGKEALSAALELTRQLSEQQDRANEVATGKAEAATHEQIKALEQSSAVSRKALEDKIDDARTRLTTMESLTRGIKEAGTESREHKSMLSNNMHTTFMALSFLVSLIALIVAIMIHIHP